MWLAENGIQRSEVSRYMGLRMVSIGVNPEVNRQDQGSIPCNSTIQWCNVCGARAKYVGIILWEGIRWAQLTLNGR